MYTLCLSGGGFRATLFHLGVVRRLIYLGIFKEIGRINSVSGGSIAAGMIMKEYTVNGKFNSVEEFDKRVIVPIIDFIQRSPKRDIYRFVPFQRSIKGFQKVLDKYLFDDKLFSDLTKDIEWVCYATSLNSLMSWKFSQVSIGDSKIGFTVPNLGDKISFAVSASACFPPLFKPIKFKTKGKTFRYKYKDGNKINTINDTPPKEIFLLDGGVYDNLGSESILQKSSDFIVSDASAVSNVWSYEKPNKFEKLKRVIDITMDQNSKLRRRLIFNKLYKQKDSVIIEASKDLSTYTEKIIPSKPSPTSVKQMPKYEVPQFEIEKNIGLIRTDLNAFHDLEIQLLLWNGMIKIDAALKRWVPWKIKKVFWNDVPTLKMNNEELKEAVKILNEGKATKIYGESHKKLHFYEEFKLNISNKL